MQNQPLTMIPLNTTNWFNMMNEPENNTPSFQYDINYDPLKTEIIIDTSNCNPSSITVSHKNNNLLISGDYTLSIMSQANQPIKLTKPLTLTIPLPESNTSPKIDSNFQEENLVITIESV